MNNAAARLAYIKERLAKAAPAQGLPASGTPPEIVAVSKTHPPEIILKLIEAGHRSFGENRVQEAAAKWPELKSRYPDVTLHLIGSLQTNKAAEAVALFDIVQSLDRESLASSLKKEMEKQGRNLPCYIQVNTGEEPQKGGVAPKDVPEFLRLAQDKYGLSVVGLMCIPPTEANPAPHFALLKTLADRLGLKELSMGMSGDYEIAAALGATCVRVGSALFGERKSI